MSSAGVDLYVVGAESVCIERLRFALADIPESQSVIPLSAGSASPVPLRRPAMFLVCSCRAEIDALSAVTSIRARDATAPIVVCALRGSLDRSRLEVAGADRCLEGCEASELADAIVALIRSPRTPRSAVSSPQTTSNHDSVASRHIKELLQATTSPNPSLSRRQGQIRDLVAIGLTDKEIARHLDISYHTVRTHLGKLLRKHGVSRRTELIAWHRAAGLPPVTATC